MRFLSCVIAAVCANTVWAADLVLYTSQPNEDAQQTVDAFNKAHPDIEVEWVRDGTTKLMAKLQAELQSGVVNPDVLLIADAVTMEALKQDDRLAPYQSAEAEAYDESLYDAEGYYYGTKLITTGLVYNNRAAEQPAAWQDLTKPEYDNLIAMPSPLYSGAALITLSTLTSNPKLGWDYYQALADNHAAAQGGNGGVLKDVSAGSKAYGVIVDYLAIREAQKGAPITFVFPQEGGTAVTEPVAIMKDAKHRGAAEKFVDFLLSQDGQALVLSQGYLPAREDLGVPEGFPARDQIKLMPFDAAAALENSEADKQRFGEIFSTQ
ncbi:ABC transporter substrate-binding protein [Cardiobacteriaceae bacterium TAE3-ERU3]|nr:ABC transporter substrate-binding protein [Cardiobacteriaceae bacterium TAE3-ERU3]